MVRVAFQGEMGANSEEAAIRLFGTAIELLPRKSFELVFEAVEAGEASCGILPVENSQTGSIDEVLDLLWERHLHVTGEVKIEVHHCLIGRSSDPSVLTAHSHPQALAQCEKFLVGRGLTPVPEYDTAGSVKLLAQGLLPPKAAAIASRRAAELHGLTVLFENIETRPDNATRFYAVEKVSKATGGEKTALAFAASDSNDPLSALAVFFNRKIPVPWMDLRPLKTKAWQYVLYVEVREKSDQPSLRSALEELRHQSSQLKVLGCF